MLRRFRTSPLLWLIWSVLLLAYVTLLPPPSSFTFWAFATAGVAATIAQMVHSYRKATWEQETIFEWNERLVALGAIFDLNDRQDVFEVLDAQQWEDVLVALEKMPSGSRSLRQAILHTHPSALQ